MYSNIQTLKQHELNKWKVLGLILISAMLLCVENVYARCSRPIQVPVSAYSYTVIVKGNQFSGILPDVLSAIEAKSNCKFVYTLVPKNRQEILFETGQSDLLVSAVKTVRRDKFGIFFPFVQLRAAVISMEGQFPPLHNAKDIIARTELKLVVVRAYDYGPAYQTIVEEMTKLGRVVVESDPISVAKLIRSNPKYVTIMAPTIFSGIIQSEPVLENLNGKIRFEKLDELQWTDSGVYISKLSMSASDQVYLKAQFEKYANMDNMWKSYLNYYPPEVIKIGIRPRDNAH
jgi:polar amino acid transport system substrate-binding protein